MKNNNIEYKARAIIGGLRNTVTDVLQGTRPKVQYIHFWRGVKRKLVETLEEALELREELPADLIRKLEASKRILDRYPRPVNSDSVAISVELQAEVLGD